MGDNITRKFQQLSPLLWWLLVALLVLGFFFICKLVAGSTMRPVSKFIKNVAFNGKDCGEEIKALTNVNRSSLYESTINIQVPTESSIGLHAQNWVDSHRDWLLESYQTHVGGILRDNFLPVSGSAIDSYSLTTEEYDAVRKLEDEHFMRNILDKLMDFANAKYRLKNLNVNSKDFNDHLRRNQDAYDKCRGEISRLNQEIEDKLRNRHANADVEGIRARISMLVQRIADLDNEINLNNRDLNARLDEINRKISEWESINKRRSYLESQM